MVKKDAGTESLGSGTTAIEAEPSSSGSRSNLVVFCCVYDLIKIRFYTTTHMGCDAACLIPVKSVEGLFVLRKSFQVLQSLSAVFLLLSVVYWVHHRKNSLLFAI